MCDKSRNTWVVSTKCTPGFACRAFSDTTLVCFIVNEDTTKCSHYTDKLQSFLTREVKLVNYDCYIQRNCYRWNSHRLIRYPAIRYTCPLKYHVPKFNQVCCKNITLFFCVGRNTRFTRVLVLVWVCWHEHVCLCVWYNQLTIMFVPPFWINLL